MVKIQGYKGIKSNRILKNVFSGKFWRPEAVKADRKQQLSQVL
jgi:hypothetical protein